MPTTITPSSFRVRYPEFSDTATYPDATITAQIGVANLLLVSDRWTEILDYASGLFVAHQLSLGRRAVAGGSIPGAPGGVATSRSVGGVSVGYDTSTGQIQDGGTWNLSIYGAQFLQLARLVGSGGIQLSGQLSLEY